MREKENYPERVEGLFRTPINKCQEDNTLLNIREYRQGEKKLRSFPRRIVLELTNVCNYNCIMCGRNYSEFTPTYLDPTIIDKLRDIFDYIEEVTLFGWGEPTMHPDFWDVLEKLNAYGNLRKYVLTNGSKLESFIPVIKKGQIQILSVSLDGATAEVNDPIRRGSDFNSTIKKIKEIVALKNEGFILPYMNLVFVVMKRNAFQLPDMVRLTKALELPEIKIVFMTSFHESLDRETIWNYRMEYENYLTEALKIAEDLGVKIKIPDEVGGEFPHQNCIFPWRDLFIGADGSIRPCQSNGFVLDNIGNKDLFFDLWNGLPFQDFREKINDLERMNKDCKTCYQSSHANWSNKHAHIQSGIKSFPKWGNDRR